MIYFYVIAFLVITLHFGLNIFGVTKADKITTGGFQLGMMLVILGQLLKEIQ